MIVQARPSATTTTIYSVPTPAAGAQESSTVITGLWVANTTAGAHSFRLAVASTCAADAIAQYIYYGISIPANSSFVQSVNLPLVSTDCIRVWSDADQVLNFSLYGVTNP